MADKMTFNDLGLSESVLNAINKKGFEEPTAIQALTIPVMLRDDTNIIAQAQTGTGKTAAFGLPLIEMIDTDDNNVQALILAPTRELAIQVAEEINSLKDNRDLTIVPIYGGQSIEQQLRRLRKGVHIVVGTPGRVIDHLKRRTLKLGNIEHLILDEADEMLNMGFVEDMEEIMAHTPQDKRTLLFSATMPKRIKDLAHKYMEGYELLSVKDQQLTTNLTEQIYFEVKGSDKFEALCRIIDIEDTFYGLVFCRTKNDVDNVVSHMIDRGYDAAAIHGDISQAERERTLEKFKKQRVNILIATDVAARGIDVNNLTHVINYSLPHNSDAYVHRIGRTGRAGNEGTAITFITPSEYRKLMFIQKMAKTDIKKSTIPRVEDIIKVKEQKINDELTAALDNDIDEKYYGWAKRLLEDCNPTKILATLLNYSFEDDLNPHVYGTIREGNDRGRDRGRDGGRDRGRDGGRDRGRDGGRDRGRGRELDLEGKTRLFVALGKSDGYSARKLVDLIMDKAQIYSREIDDVLIRDNFSFMTVPFEKAEAIVTAFREKGRRPLITHAKKDTNAGSDRGDRGSRDSGRDRGGRSERPARSRRRESALSTAGIKKPSTESAPAGINKTKEDFCHCKKAPIKTDQGEAASRDASPERREKRDFKDKKDRKDKKEHKEKSDNKGKRSPKDKREWTEKKPKRTKKEKAARKAKREKKRRKSKEVI